MDNILTLKSAIESAENSAGNLRVLPTVSMLIAPSNSTYNAYLTESLDDSGIAINAFKTSASKWNFSTHLQPVVEGIVITATTTELTATEIGNILGSAPAGKFLLQFTSGALVGYCRLLNIAAINTATWTDPLSLVPQTNDTFEIYQSTSSLLAELAALGDESLINAIIFGGE